MSDQTIEEKTAAPVRTENKRPRASLEQLSRRWGFESSDAEQVRIFVMGREAKEVWYRISGEGKTAVYELGKQEGES